MRVLARALDKGVPAGKNRAPSNGDCAGPKMMTLKYRRLSSVGAAVIPGTGRSKSRAIEVSEQFGGFRGEQAWRCGQRCRSFQAAEFSGTGRRPRRSSANVAGSRREASPGGRAGGRERRSVRGAPGSFCSVSVSCAHGQRPR